MMESRGYLTGLQREW